MNKKRISFDAMAQRIPVGLCVLDKNMRILWANQLFKRFFESIRPEGRLCYEVISKKNGICQDCPALRAILTKKTTSGIYKILKKEKLHYYCVSSSPVKNEKGEITQVIELFEDITKKKEKEKQKLRIIRTLNKMCRRLREANKKLSQHIEELKRQKDSTFFLHTQIKKRYHKKLKELSFTKKELKELFELGKVISQTADLRKILRAIVHLTCEIIHTDACILRLLDKDKMRLIPEEGVGFKKEEIFNKFLKVGQGLSGRVARTLRPSWVEDIYQQQGILGVEVFRGEGWRSALAVPVIFNKELLGIITLYSRKKRKFSQEELNFLMNFSQHASLAIQETRLYNEVHSHYFNTIRTLVKVVEEKDPLFRGHAERVTYYALKIAQKIRISEQELKILRYACEVHDVGKIAIPNSILNKPDKLTPVEWAVVKLHPLKGVELLEPLRFLASGLSVVKHHHERYDGDGYPEGLRGEDIPLLARIVSCADAFDAMTANRPYRKERLTTQEAMRELRKNSSTQFDPYLSKVFISILKKE